jgi:hypothetical protein
VLGGIEMLGGMMFGAIGLLVGVVLAVGLREGRAETPCYQVNELWDCNTDALVCSTMARFDD